MNLPAGSEPGEPEPDPDAVPPAQGALNEPREPEPAPQALPPAQGALNEPGEPEPAPQAVPPAQGSLNEPDSPAPEPAPESLSEPAATASSARGRVLIALVADNEREPPSSLNERQALATWAAISALWHPALLARVDRLPIVESLDQPSGPAPGEIRVLAEGEAERLPSGYRTQADDAGAPLVEGGTDRVELARELLARLEPEAAPALGDNSPESTRVANDFFALGTARHWLRTLTVAMGHIDALDVESLTREVLASARAWQAGDCGAAVNRLRASFELLTQARERFYPVDAYFIDICLLDPSTPAESVGEVLAARAAVSFLAPALAIERLAEQKPEHVAAIREAVTEGWVDVVGGAYAEVEEPLLPLESVVWQFRKGAEVYRHHLDGRNVETLARRRFALYPLLPQLAKRFGFRFAMHMGFDAGRFPVRPEPKRLWESPDGTSLESLTRPPLAADRAASGAQLPWRLARSMKDDHVATLPLVHWPAPVAPWLLDLRRVVAYSPVLARAVTLGDFFHLTDRPYETFQPKLDEYETPYLAQAVARQAVDPISRLVEHTRLRARVDGLGWLRCMSRALAGDAAVQDAPAEPANIESVETEAAVTDPDPRLSAIENDLELGHWPDARGALDHEEPLAAQALAATIAGTLTEGRPGYLVFNPLGVARRAAVLLKDAALDLRPEGPLRAAQFTEEGVWAVVELAAFGFAWVPREASLDVPPGPTTLLSASGRVLHNESVELEIDPATGGIRALRASGEKTARMGQQLVIEGLNGPGGQPAPSKMIGEGYDVDYGGPALVQAVSRGRLIEPADGRTLARFRQRFRLWSGRPLAELNVELEDVDTAWLERIADHDPWRHYIACRWAWSDADSPLRRLSLLSALHTDAERPETPDAIDIATRKQRTALVFGGLAHHRRHGNRMLDTLLITGKEQARSFSLGIALDLEHPFHAALDMVAPVYTVPTDSGPLPSGSTGWFFQLDHRAVAVTSVRFADHTGDGRGWGVVFRMLETAGRAARCRLRLLKNPTWARQTDFSGESIVDLSMDGDSVAIDLTPHELAQVEVTLG